MRQKDMAGACIKSCKAVFLAALIFLVLMAGFGLLVRFTPLPERFIMHYTLAALCVSCLFLGVYAGNLLKSRGFLFGALYSAAFLLLLLLAIAAGAGEHEGAGFFQLRYLSCLLFGSLGGAVGVNLRT